MVYRRYGEHLRRYRCISYMPLLPSRLRRTACRKGAAVRRSCAHIEARRSKALDYDPSMSVAV
jgi:hypothetical protein